MPWLLICTFSKLFFVGFFFAFAGNGSEKYNGNLQLRDSYVRLVESANLWGCGALLAHRGICQKVVQSKKSKFAVDHCRIKLGNSAPTCMFRLALWSYKFERIRQYRFLQLWLRWWLFYGLWSSLRYRRLHQFAGWAGFSVGRGSKLYSTLKLTVRSPLVY